MAKTNQKGLGRGLGALFTEPESPALQQETPQTLPIQKLEPNRKQPRREFDPEALQDLSESIQEHGILQPIAVRPMESGYYQIIAGERRWRAAREANLKEVPVHILTVDDQEAAELALIENLQREDLNPMEEARGFEALMQDYNMTQEDAAKRVGKSRPAVANALRLLKLPKSVVSLIEDGSLSAGHARALIPLEEESLQRDAAKRIIDQQLSVRQTEALVKRLTKPEPEEKPVDILKVDYYKECEKALTKALGRKVYIQPGAKKGKFTIEYYGDEDLQTLMDALEQL